MRRWNHVLAIVVATATWIPSGAAQSTDRSLVGHWKLRGDCRDYSGAGNHGVNHGVELEMGVFDGASAYIEVPNSDSLRLGSRDFAICAWIETAEQIDDIVGDVLDFYDPARRRGITLSISSSAGGYQSQGTDRHVHFGIDDAKTTDWQDCGRPNATSNYVSNSLTVYKGRLYAATTDAQDEGQWCHVYRYDGAQNWIDCGRVGNGRTTGVLPLIVHDGELYAATSTYDWTRVRDGSYDPGRVYRYLGGKQWEDCGQPSEHCTLHCMASYKGKLYVGGGRNDQESGVFVHEGGSTWRPSKIFAKAGPERLFPHAMCRHNGMLFVAYPGAWSFDGDVWTYAGDTLPPDQNWFLQTHSLTIFQGKLHAGTWPESKVSVYEGGKDWRVMGRVGVGGMEVMALAAYNGKLFGASIPRAEVCRYDGEFEWTSLKRFYSPEGYDPGVPGKMSKKQVNEASRVTSLTIFDGKLFASTGSSTSSVLDAPADVRGKVFSMEAGKMASYDDDLGPGWKHLAAVRDGGLLKLYIDGELVAESTAFDPKEYDLSHDSPLRIGFGQTEYFDGRMADVRLYRTALSEAQIQELCSQRPD